MNQILYILSLLFSFSIVTAIVLQPALSSQIQLETSQTQQQIPIQIQQGLQQQPLTISPSCRQVITQNVI